MLYNFLTIPFLNFLFNEKSLGPLCQKVKTLYFKILKQEPFQRKKLNLIMSISY